MSESHLRVLVVDDELPIRRFLRASLSAHDYGVLEAENGEAALSAVAAQHPDVVILDLGLPDVDGIEVTRRLREWTHIPIIILSVRGAEGDKIAALDAGADDYVTKPFSVGELVARINAIFRRLYRSSAGDEVIRIGQVMVYPRRHELQRNRKTVPLSFYEVEILRLLHERAGEPVSREEIMEKIWGVTGGGSSRSVDNFVVKLRKKVEEDAASPRHIVTIYGTGYKLLL